MIYYIAGYNPIKNLSSRVHWYAIYLTEEQAKNKLDEYIEKYDMFYYMNNCYRSKTGFVCWMRSMPLEEFNTPINPCCPNRT